MPVIIKKPQDQDQPDAEHRGVFSLFPDDGVNEEKEDHTERDQHHGILDKEGFNDESLYIHTNALGITHRYFGCQSVEAFCADKYGQSSKRHLAPGHT